MAINSAFANAARDIIERIGVIATYQKLAGGDPISLYVDPDVELVFLPDELRATVAVDAKVMELLNEDIAPDTPERGDTITIDSTTYTYGSATPEPTGKRPWYKPPKRTKSAKHPSEWFFWTGWGLYVFLRFIFQILFFALMIGLRSRRR